MTNAIASIGAAALVAALAGCGGGESLSPRDGAIAVTPDASAPTPDAGGEDAGADVPDASAPADAGAKKREVFERNPFGNVAARDNLLWDGDFEWSSAFSDQYGWINVPITSLTFTGVRVGPECRSGLKCAAVKKGGGLVGIAVTSRGQELAASVWAKPTSANASPPSCTKITALLTSNGGTDADAVLPPDADAPDASGWCHFAVIAPPRSDKPYLYLQNDTGAELVVDDAVIVRAPVEKVHTLEIRPPTQDEVAAHATLVAELAKLPRGPHDPPPNAARRAVERRGAP